MVILLNNIRCLLIYIFSVLVSAENKEFMDKGAVFILPCSSTVSLLNLVEGHKEGLRNLE